MYFMAAKKSVVNVKEREKKKLRDRCNSSINRYNNKEGGQHMDWFHNIADLATLIMFAAWIFHIYHLEK